MKPSAEVATKTTDDALAASNSLADLAARIRIEHRAASDKMSEALRIRWRRATLDRREGANEARPVVAVAGRPRRDQRPHRSSLYAGGQEPDRDRRNAQSAADLSLGEAMALLALSSDVRKLLSFVKRCEGLEGEDLMQACLDAGVGIITPRLRSLRGRSDEQRREWKLFGFWLLPQLGVEGAVHSAPPRYCR